MRIFSNAPKASITYTRRPGAYGVIRRGSDLLVTEQTAENVEIQLPGGGIDPGESPLVALHRECLEETGWRVQPQHYLGRYQRFVFMPEYDLWAHKVCHVFLCSPGRRIGPPSEPGHRAFWMNWRNAVDQFSDPGDGFFVTQLMRRMA